MEPIELLRQKRHLGMTNKKLAEFLGVSERAVEYWLAGKRKIPLSVKHALAWFNEHQRKFPLRAPHEGRY